MKAVRKQGPPMATITTNDIKNGMTLQIDDGLFQIVDFQHVKPGKGHAFVRTTLKNARTGAVIDRTFRAGEKVEQATIHKAEMHFLYREADDYVFMDNSTYRPGDGQPAGARRRRQLSRGVGDGDPADARRGDGRLGAGGLGRAGDRRDRAGDPG